MINVSRHVLMIVAGGMFLSTLGVGTRLMETANSFQIVFYRGLALAVFSTLLVIWLHRKGTVAAFRSSGKTGFVGGMLFAAASLFIVLAVNNTSVANAMFIISLAPLFAGLFAWGILGESIQGKTWVAIMVALLGVFILVNGALSTEGLIGIGYALLMAVFYALFTVSLRSGKDQNMIPSICWSSYALVLVLGLALKDLAIPLNDLLICIALGVFQVGLGSLLIILGSREVPAAQLTVLAMLEVVLSPLWVWIGVGEIPAWSTLTGGMVILMAIAWEALRSPEQTN